MQISPSHCINPGNSHDYSVLVRNVPQINKRSDAANQHSFLTTDRSNYELPEYPYLAKMPSLCLKYTLFINAQMEGHSHKSAIWTFTVMSQTTHLVNNPPEDVQSSLKKSSTYNLYYVHLSD